MACGAVRVQPQRNARAEKLFLARLIDRFGELRIVTTDKPRSKFHPSSSIAFARRQGDLRTLMRRVAAFCDETRKIYDLVDTAHPFATTGAAR